MLAAKSARFKSSGPGFGADLPNSDSIPAARNPRNELIFVQKGILTTCGPRFSQVNGSSTDNYLCTASFTEASNSTPVLLVNSDLLNNWCLSRISA